MPRSGDLVRLAKGKTPMIWRSTTLLVCLCCAVASPLARAQAPDARPNVVLILTDDMGYADLGSYGATDVRTPHIA
jgi:hypothetical protein